MKLAFVAFNYNPYGGLTRDMLAMARLCQSRGHDVVVYVGSLRGETIDFNDIPVRTLKLKRTFSNAGFNSAVINAVRTRLIEESDRTVIGFNKMPGLDFYYAADSCFAAKAQSRNKLYRSTHRAQRNLLDEAAVFSSSSHTHCLMISKPEIVVYQQFYQTPSERLHLLPPGIRPERVMPADYNTTRTQLRQHYGLTNDDCLILMVGTNYKLKGLDRALQGIASLPANIKERTQLWIAGIGNAAPFKRQAKRLGIGDKLQILGPRDDVSELMWAADAFLHPAYMENTGTVLLEAMVAGLPVVVTDVCGYASYISDFNMGQVLSDPINGQTIANALQKVLSKPRPHWTALSREFAKEDIYSMTERACELIEKLG